MLPKFLMFAATIGPGGYLSVIKIALIAIVFFVWVKLADWINQDSVRLVSRLPLEPKVWNPIVVASFFVGFLIAISLPMFVVGYPVFVLAAFGPWLAYYFTRRSKLAETPSVARALQASGGGDNYVEVLPQDEGADIEFTPAGDDNSQQQKNLISARQSEGFTGLKDLLYDCLFKRSEQVMLDFSREKVAARMLIDGVWHPRKSMDRPTGDAMLVSLKSLAGLNPADRKNRQDGSFGMKSELGKIDAQLTTQGVKTGERAILKFVAKKKGVLSLAELGMFPDMEEKLKPTLNQQGMGIVSAPPSGGLKTSWQSILYASDRLTRDCVLIVDGRDDYTSVENFVVHEYDSEGSVVQQDVIRKMLLSQPDMIAVPKIEDAATTDLLSFQAVNEDRTVMTRVRARTAAEGLLRAYKNCSERELFANAVQFVTCQKLMRRLCDTCKQKVRVKPQMIQQLGGDPKKQNTLYNQWRLPPPEQRVDEKGREIEFPPCETCGGIGYISRIAVFELLEVNDAVRKTLLTNPKLEAVEQAAKEAGKKSLASNAYKLVLLGVTSLAEAQRALKEG